LKLAVYVSPKVGADGGGKGTLFSVFTGLGALFIAILIATGYYLRESGREIRLAGQRVTFVNQVSHELKTPLTNLRLYAELLEMEIDEADDKSRAHLDVIVQESRRLTRLIANVLTFGRGMRQQLELHEAPARVDDIVKKTVQQFEPSFSQKEIDIELDLDASDIVRVDADALEQILGNLLSNVEKYAVKGKYVKITSRREDDQTLLIVEDRGEGILRAVEKRIFDPFFRVSGAVTEGVSGAGIGLAIARDLARLHGGDLVQQPGDTGARFKVVLRTSSV
jgi:signal transduction histidine kinase